MGVIFCRWGSDPSRNYDERKLILLFRRGTPPSLEKSSNKFSKCKLHSPDTDLEHTLEESGFGGDNVSQVNDNFLLQGDFTRIERHTLRINDVLDGSCC